MSSRGAPASAIPPRRGADLKLAFLDNAKVHIWRGTVVEAGDPKRDGLARESWTASGGARGAARPYCTELCLASLMIRKDSPQSRRAPGAEAENPKPSPMKPASCR